MIALGLGTVAFSMQDILLEPFGGEVLKLPVASTTALTAALALGGLAGFVMAARALGVPVHQLLGGRRRTRFDLRGQLDCGSDVEIDVNCVFEGAVSLADGVSIGANCVIKDVAIGAGTRIELPPGLDPERLAHLGVPRRGSTATVLDQPPIPLK